jgi:hypothetical protein
MMKEYGLGPNEDILTFERGEDATIGPRLYSFIKSLYRTVSWILMLAPNGSVITAGSRLTTDTCSEKIFFTS